MGATLQTALIHACFFNQSHSVDLLLSSGAKIDIKSLVGATELMFAAGWGNAHIVDALISKGANVNAKDNEGKSALDYAHDHPDIVAILKAAGAK